MTLLLSWLFLINYILISFVHTSCGQLNLNPIIGVVEEETTFFVQRVYGEKYKTSIAASYVKFVEGAGARVVPVPLGRDEDFYKNLLLKINGVLFPGGAVYFTNSNGYADTGVIIYKLAKEMNDNGIYFPLWGTCLGFELLSYLSTNRQEHRAICSSNNQALNLEFKSDFNKSRMFGNAPSNVIDILKNENVTANFHNFCITEKNLTTFGVDHEWKVLSLNKDKAGFEFISSFEHQRYPFYGVQFHPEKNIYEWIKNKNISHTPNAILASQYFANFFINESRKNENKFMNKTEENQHLIYNYVPTFTGIKGSVFDQIYLFPQSEMERTLSNNNMNNKSDGMKFSQYYLLAILVTWLNGKFLI